MKNLREIFVNYKKHKKVSFWSFIMFNILIIITGVIQILKNEYGLGLACILYILIMMLPVLLQARFKFILSEATELLFYTLFVSGSILGTLYNFYGNIPHWDTWGHTLNGFLWCGIGFSLSELLNKENKKLKQSAIYTTIVALCFSTTMSICWEFYEYGMDKFFLTDMHDDVMITSISSVLFEPDGKRKSVVIAEIDKTVLYDETGNVLKIINNGYLDIGLNDIMKDLLVQFLGALTLSTLGYFHLKDKKRFKFIQYFIPKTL